MVRCGAEAGCVSHCICAVESVPLHHHQRRLTNYNYTTSSTLLNCEKLLDVDYWQKSFS